MKDFAAKTIKGIIKNAAKAGCESTSLLCLYQPKTPKQLLKHDIKKNKK